MNDVINEVASAACSIGSFAFVVRSARAVREVSRPGGHVFLVPEEGAAEIVALHDRLYSGAFHSSLRSDIPYLPHITVAAGSEWHRCEALANDLNRDVRVVGGRVEAIELLDDGVGEIWVRTVRAPVPMSDAVMRIVKVPSSSARACAVDGARRAG